MMFDENDAEELIRVNLKLTKENNAMLRAMRRDAWIGRLLKIILLIAIVLAPLYFYYKYLEPKVEQLQETYFELQGNMEALQELRDKPETFTQWLVGLTAGGDASHTAGADEKAAEEAVATSSSEAEE